MDYDVMADRCDTWTDDEKMFTFWYLLRSFYVPKLEKEVEELESELNTIEKVHRYYKMTEHLKNSKEIGETLTHILF